MSIEEASKILKMLLGFLKGEIEPPSPKTIEEAEKFEQEGYECLSMAIRSLEAWKLVKNDLRSYEADCQISADSQTCKRCSADTFKSVERIIDKHLKEVVENADID